MSFDLVQSWRQPQFSLNSKNGLTALILKFDHENPVMLVVFLIFRLKPVLAQAETCEAGRASDVFTAETLAGFQRVLAGVPCGVMEIVMLSSTCSFTSSVTFRGRKHNQRPIS